jgi:PAS domain S-box-containing protein
LDAAHPRGEEKERALADELRRTQALLERLIDSSPDAVVACDMAGRIVLFSKGAERLLRYTADEALASRTVAELYSEALVDEVLQRLRVAGPGGRLEGLRGEVRTRFGEHIPVTISASLLMEEGEEMAWVAVLADQRERLSIERRLSSAEEKLRESEKQAMIAELAGAAAHELNQPLTSVLGYADLLRRKLIQSDPSFRFIEIIYREAERMAEIVKKIGRITRYETTTYVGNVKIVDIEKATDK